MKLERSILEDVLILINSVDDEIKNCKLRNCKIVTRVPVLLEDCVIEWKKPLQAIPIDEEKPHAKILTCYLIECEIEGHPNFCLFKEVK
jgi:hypothetical protein